MFQICITSITIKIPITEKEQNSQVTSPIISTMEGGELKMENVLVVDRYLDKKFKRKLKHVPESLLSRLVVNRRAVLLLCLVLFYKEGYLFIMWQVSG